MRYLWKDQKKVNELLSSKRKKIIFLDFDGTLISVVKTPEEVTLDPEIKKIIEDLSKNGQNRVVIISGRALKELHAHFKLKNVILAGNHGLEIKGNGVALPIKAKKARKLKHFISVMSRKFEMAFTTYPGVWVEDKKFTLSIHFKNLPKGEGAVFRELVHFFREKYKHYPIVWIEGKKVVEVRPGIYWGKGETVSHLLQKNHRAIPIAIGDDKTDEDMFKALKKRGGLNIHVGRLKSSAADYYLKSPGDVKTFLKKL